MNIVLSNKISNIAKSKYYNIILSPDFYHIKEFDIPTNSLNKAKKLVKNLFEEYIDINGKDFYLKKIDNFRYIAIAYDEQKIKNRLKKLKIDQKIKGIYFAQFELSFDGCVNVDGVSLINVDGLILLNLVEDSCKNLDISKIKLSNNKLVLNEFNFFSNTQLKLLIFMILFSSGINFFKYFQTKNQIDNIPFQIEKLKKEYKLFPSKIQTKSVIDELILKKDKFNKFRDKLYDILTFSKDSDTILKYIEFNNEQFEVVFETNNMPKLIKLVNSLNPTKKNINNKILKIWIKL